MIDYEEFFFARGEILDRISEIYNIQRKKKVIPLLFNWSLNWTESDVALRKRTLNILKGDKK